MAETTDHHRSSWDASFDCPESIHTLRRTFPHKPQGVDDHLDSCELDNESDDVSGRFTDHIDFNFLNLCETFIGLHPHPIESNLIWKLRRRTPWPEARSKLVGIIDDCDNDGSRPNCSGGLSLDELSSVLMRNARKRDANNVPVEDNLMPDIRRIYISHVTTEVILCLAQTEAFRAPGVLAEFIHDHLEGLPLSISRIIPDGFKQFRFEFHLPYFALRSCGLVRWDSRMLRDDGVVRQDRDVSFLSSNGWTSTKLDGYTPGTTVLYEAQTSCLVVGHHSTAWTAHMLTDSYFADSEDTEYNEDTVNSWEEQRQDDGKPDPFTLGQTLADTPFLGARDYFITVLATRLKRVYHEWDLVTEYASRGVSKWQREAEAVPTLSAAWTFQTPAKSLSISLAPSCVKHTRMKHARMISDLLTDLHASLSDMLSEQERFLPTVQEMFCDDAGPVSASNRPRLRRGRLDEIETTIWRLRRRQTQLQNMRDKMLRKVYPQGRIADSPVEVGRTKKGIVRHMLLAQWPVLKRAETLLNMAQTIINDLWSLAYYTMVATCAMHTISCMQNASLYLSATAQNRVALGGLMFVIVFMIKSIIKYVLRDH